MGVMRTDKAKGKKGKHYLSLGEIDQATFNIMQRVGQKYDLKASVIDYMQRLDAQPLPTKK